MRVRCLDLETERPIEYGGVRDVDEIRNGWYIIDGEAYNPCYMEKVPEHFLEGCSVEDLTRELHKRMKEGEEYYEGRMRR